jgi:hypothetical protein
VNAVLKAVCLIAALALSWTPVSAQWPARRTNNVPRTADGALNVDAPTPRTTDGKPDLSGVWRAGGGSYAMGRPTGFTYPGSNVYQAVGLSVLPYAGAPPRTDYGDELFKARQATNSRDNPRGRCLPVGIIQLHMAALPARYIQTPRQLVMLYEGNGESREIFTDGRRLPDNDPQPWWNGYSVGRWEDDVLVAETAHLRDGGWLDSNGNPLTDAARITERFRRTSYGRMEIDITIDDPKAYVRPFTVRWNQRLATDDEIIESVCLENNHFPPAPDRGNR